MYFDRKDDIAFIKWAKAVKIRDRFVCQICERRGVELNAHHKNSWDVFIEDRYDIDNGTTLCATCHNAFHSIYGFGNNTKEQFDEFEQLCQTMLRVISFNYDLSAAIKDVTAKLEDGYK